MEKKYCVAGHLFAVKSVNDDVWGQMTNYIPFEVTLDAEGHTDTEKPLFTLNITDPSEKLSGSDEREPFVIDPADEPDMPRVDVYRQEEGWLFEFFPTAVSKTFFTVWMSEDFRIGRIHEWNVKRYGRFPVDNALMIQYVMATAELGTIGIHASVIAHSGKGHIFLGVSGTGKSTHSRLWLENIVGSHLLNDDNPVVRVGEDGVARVYGTPWSGKTPCYNNESVPVAAFVELKQAPRNSIGRLPVIESYVAIEASTSGVRQIPSVEEGLFRTLRAVLEHVPCYHLDCLPDAEAARLCAETCGVKFPEVAELMALSDKEVLPVIGQPRLNVKPIQHL